MEDIANFFQITDNIGTGGQPNISQINEIAKANYSVVINLAMHDSDNAIPGEDKIVTSLGMKYMHIPVPFDAPTSDHLEHFFSAMDSFENDRVFVHCAANYRASVFMYKYLTLRKGVAHEKAASVAQKVAPYNERPMEINYWAGGRINLVLRNVIQLQRL